MFEVIGRGTVRESEVDEIVNAYKVKYNDKSMTWSQNQDTQAQEGRDELQ